MAASCAPAHESSGNERASPLKAELGDDPVSVTYKGRSIRLCCKSCVKKFNAAPEKYIALLDKAQAGKRKESRSHE